MELELKNVAIYAQGEAGCNIMNTLIDLYGTDTFRFIVSDTNKDTLNSVAKGADKIQLGEGVGAGIDPKVAEQFVTRQAFKDELTKKLEGVDVCFCVAGLGGGTGSAISKAIEHIRSMGIAVYCIATTPFAFELQHESIRQANTDYAVSEIKKQSICYQLFDNEILVEKFGDLSPFSAFRKSDVQVAQCLEAILEIIKTRAFPNIDINDIKRFLTHAKGEALFNVGEGSTLAESMANAQDMSYLTHRNFKRITGLISMSTGNDENVTMGEMSKELNQLSQKLAVGAVNKSGMGRSKDDKIYTYILIGGLDNNEETIDAKQALTIEQRIKALRTDNIKQPKAPTTKPELGARKAL